MKQIIFNLNDKGVFSMKLLHIIAQKPNSTGSGVYMTELVKAFNHLGISQEVVAGISMDDTTCFLSPASFSPVIYNSDELPYPVLGMSDEMPYPSTRYNQLTPDMIDCFRQAFLSRIAPIMNSFQPDFVFCHHLYLLTAIVREQYPEQKICGFCHGTDLRQFKKNPLLRSFIKSQIQKLDFIFALHQPQKEDICDLFSVSQDRVNVIGSGYNHRIFFPVSTAIPHHNTIVFAGKLCEKKGVKSLLHALNFLPQDLPNLELLLAGGSGVTHEMESIHHIAKSSPIPVHFLGKLNHKELAAVLQKTTVFVLPSFFEGLPLVIMEALACGAKVICNDLPGISQWVTEHIPNHGIHFVDLPLMLNIDEPDPLSLPAYEKRLGEAIALALTSPENKVPDMSAITWEGLASCLLHLINV